MRPVHATLVAILMMTMVVVATAGIAATTAPAVRNAWARATPPGVPAAAVYLELTAVADEVLVGASTPMAEHAEAHSSIESDGVMRMRPEPELQLAAGKPVIFRPGGLHLMLTGLRKPLAVGATFALTLRFRDSGDVSVQVSVRPAAYVAAR